MRQRSRENLIVWVKKKNARCKRTCIIPQHEEAPVATTGAIMKNLCAICLISKAK